MSGIPRLSMAAACVALSLASLTACSPGGSTPDASIAEGDVPRFTGTYADEYRETWLSADIDFVRDVIRDEEITEQEWAEVVKRFDDCLDEHDIELVEYEEDGAYGVERGAGLSDERVQDAMKECEGESGETVLGRLWHSQRQNPSNRDPNELIYDCLIRLGALDPSYSLENYLRDNPEFAFPFLTDEGPDLYATCSSAPLTTAGDRRISSH